MGGISQKFDRQLFTLKLSEPARQMQMESLASDNAARSAKLGGSVLVRIVDGQLAVLRKWLETGDRICREVWQRQGETIAPDFVRDVLLQEAMTLIGARESTVKANVAGAAQRTHLEDPHDALQHLAMEIRKLQGEVGNRYEIEARELEYEKASAAQSGPQSQLDEPGGIRGLIEDATKDTTLWLQADPSAEERVYVLAMQGRLADLDRIASRRIERRVSPRDSWEWSEAVRDLLSLVEKARGVRGKIVGNGLSRLADHLPEKFPGKPKPKLPAPVEVVNTSGGISLSPASLASSATGGLKSLDYPGELSHEARDRIEREKIRASREVLPASVYEFEDQELAIRCIMRIFLAFAREVCALRKERAWTLDRVQREGEEFLRRLTITVIFAKFPGLDRYWINNLNGSILSDVERRFRASREWQQYEELLLESPLESSLGTTSQTDSARKSAPTLQAETCRAQNSDKTGQSSESRRAMVDAYIAKVLAKTGKKISRKDVWLAAGYGNATEFERFQRNDPRTTQSAVTNFHRVLGMAHEDFIRLLETRKANKNTRVDRAE